MPKNVNMVFVTQGSHDSHRLGCSFIALYLKTYIVLFRDDFMSFSRWFNLHFNDFSQGICGESDETNSFSSFSDSYAYH